MSGRTPAIFALVLAGVVLIYALSALTSTPGTVTSPVPSTFSVGGKSFVFSYVAVTEAQREAGLMNRQITDATTMLFAFPSFGNWRFWMLDTNTSLDMIWVKTTGSTGRVVYLVTDAQPCYNSATCTQYIPTSSANYVIEARSGFVSSNGISIGTPISFS